MLVGLHDESGVEGGEWRIGEGREVKRRNTTKRRGYRNRKATLTSSEPPHGGLGSLVRLH